jgi:predicted HTH transcriptional regulator
MKTLTLIIVGIIAVGLGYWLGKNKSRKNNCTNTHSPKLANDNNRYISNYSPIEANSNNKSDRGDGGGVEGESVGLIEKQAEEKKRNLAAILGLMESGNQPLTNNLVEQMLGIPESTVTRYFDELEKEGKVRQVGKTGGMCFMKRFKFFLSI